MSVFLSTTELADLRTDFAATLPDTCTVEYVTRTPNGNGTWSDTWTARGTAIACRMIALTGRDFPQLTAAQVKEGRYWTFEFAAAQTVAVSDRITRAGLVYQVLQTNAGQSELIKQKVLAEIRQ
jgi:hypothetical protein